MKIISSILLFIFITLITVPSVIALIEDSCELCIDDKSENRDSLKEIKIELIFLDGNFLRNNLFKEPTKMITSVCKFKHEEISSNIFIPPPERV